MKDPIDNVYDSIIKLNKLLDRLPASVNGDFRNYRFTNISKVTKLNIEDDSLLFINNSKIDKTTIDTIQVLLVYTLTEKREIILLTKYLKDNYLWGAGYQFNGANVWSYDYRGSCERGFNDCRTIIALKNLSDTLQIKYGSLDKILDRKGKLVLCAPVDIE